MLKLINVYTLSGAAKKWGLATSTLRFAIHEKRFKPDEIIKPGHDWFIKHKAMVRLYGEPKN